MRHGFFKRSYWILAVVLMVLAIQYLRPLPPATAHLQLPQPPHAQDTALPWPDSGQSALAADGYGILASHGAQRPAPIGSTAKIITALAILKQKPVTSGSKGPTLTLSQADVDLFNSYYSQDGSVTNVADGEKITEYQALESLLIPSSNNMADTLAAWAFGSKDAYIKYANQMVENMGLSHTTIGDTNGFSDTTTSTASDLAKLGMAAINNPTIAKVVDETSAQVPVEGVIKNTNFLLGSDGIVGIKTGHTDKAGGNYVFAAKRTIQGHQITLVGAVLNQPTITDAIQSSPPLISSADKDFQLFTIKKDQELGTYKTPWGAQAKLVLPQDASLLVWKGSAVKIKADIDNVKPPVKAGSAVGDVRIYNSDKSVSSPVIINDDMLGPGWTWHIYH